MAEENPYRDLTADEVQRLPLWQRVAYVIQEFNLYGSKSFETIEEWADFVMKFEGCRLDVDFLGGGWKLGRDNLIGLHSRITQLVEEVERHGREA